MSMLLFLLKRVLVITRCFWRIPLDTAYDPTKLTEVFEVRHNKIFLSPTIKKSRNPNYELGVNSKVTRFAFDPMDYYDPTTTCPPDDHQIYVRVQEVHKSGVVVLYPRFL